MMLAWLLAGSLLAGSGDAASQAAALLGGWRERPGGAAVATQVVVHEGDAESAAMAEPCVLAWDVEAGQVALRRGGLTVAISEGRLRATHRESRAAMDLEVGDRALEAWRETFDDAPWPQPAMAMLAADRWPAELDPESGALQVESLQLEGEDRVLQLRGPRGRWTIRFRGDRAPRLVEAVRRIDAGPRVPPGAWIEWRMRFEHAEPESGIFSPEMEGRVRVGRLAAVLPQEEPSPPPRRADRPGEHEVEATPEQRGDSIAPKP